MRFAIDAIYVGSYINTQYPVLGRLCDAQCVRNAYCRGTVSDPPDLRLRAAPAPGAVTPNEAAKIAGACEGAHGSADAPGGIGRRRHLPKGAIQP
jgi:hypothetical protein